MSTGNTALKMEESSRLKPCQHCGELIPRRVYNGTTVLASESWERYEARMYCSQKCHFASRQPPPGRVCEHCGELLVRREKENVTEWRNRRFCNRKCKGLAHSKQARKDRLARGHDKCTVPGCNNLKGKGLRFLCVHHYENEDEVKELPQDSMMDARSLLSAFFTAMEEPLKLTALTFSDAEYKQDELEFYKLMTPAERREIRRYHD